MLASLPGNEPSMERKKSFTGHSRRRVTRFSVRLGEFLSRWIITIGGIGTIVAVILVGVFLVWVAAPLFRSTPVTIGHSVPVTSPDARLLRFGADEYQLLGWSLFADGTVQVIRLDTGQQLKQWKPFEPDEQLTACSPAGSTSDIAFGFADGKVRIGYIRFKTSFLKNSQVDEQLRHLPEGEIVEYEGTVADFKGGLVSHMSGDLFSVQQIEVEPGDPVKVENQSPVAQIDLSMRDETENSDGTLTFLTGDGQLHTVTGKKSLSATTGNIYFKPEFSGQLDLSAQMGGGKPAHVLLSGVGDNVFVAWTDGHAVRVSTQEVEAPKVVEEFNFIGQDGVTLTALEFMIGKTTLLAGDSSGRVRAWFRVKPSQAVTGDGNVMVAAHDLGSSGSPVTSLAVSSRTRMAVAGGEDGRFRLLYVTSEKQLAELSSPGGEPIRGLLIAPKDNAILVRTSEHILTCQIDAQHNYPEITLLSLFTAGLVRRLRETGSRLASDRRRRV